MKDKNYVYRCLTIEICENWDGYTEVVLLDNDFDEERIALLNEEEAEKVLDVVDGFYKRFEFLKDEGS